MESTLQDFNESNYQISGNTVKVSYASVNPLSPEFIIRIPINNEQLHCQANLKLNEFFLNEVYGLNTTMHIDNLYYNLIEEKAEVALYPNPITDRLFVSLKHFENSEVLIELFDVAGNRVESRKFNIQDIFETIEFSDKNILNKGVYLVKISNKSFSNYYKIIAE